MSAGRKGGSGFIFDTEGNTAFVATAHHVIEDEDAIDVRVENTRTYKATLLGYDSDNDVAVMSICCDSNFKALEWKADASYEVGDQVVAVGYPRSSSSSVTATIGTVKDDRASVAFGYIAHDAPLNPGNSGGPLFSKEGKVLGINTAISTRGDGIGYAVPYSTVADKIADWKSRLIVTDEAWPTPTPSLVPTPTPTPTCPTPAEAAYLADVEPILPPMGAALSRFNELVGESGRNPLIFLDKDWKIKLAIQMVLITRYAQDILDLDPPLSIRAVSDPLEKSAQGLIAAMDRFAYSIDNLDTAALSEAVMLYGEVAAYLAEATSAIENHC